jgi:hypothetical protein
MADLSWEHKSFEATQLAFSDMQGFGQARVSSRMYWCFLECKVPHVQYKVLVALLST